MSRLDEFPSQWNNCLSQIEQYLAQQPIPLDTLTTQIDTLANAIAQAETAWRGVHSDMLKAQLEELEQRRQQAQFRLENARKQGQAQITQTIKRLKRELGSMETPAALARMHKTLDKFQTRAQELVARRDECTQAIEQYNARLESIAAELDELAEERQELEEELKELRAHSITRELRQQCLAQARATSQLWQSLREPLIAKASPTNV
jgi:chromosome segregation ATPase